MVTRKSLRTGLFSLSPLYIAFGLITSAVAADFAKIIALKPPAQFDGKELQAGQVLPHAGAIETGAGGAVKLEILATHTAVQVSPGSRLELSSPGGKGEQESSLARGTVHFIVPKSGATRPVFRIRTKSAVMGVRGTDFMSVYNPLLGESEIVVFDGLVEFQSALDPNDKKDIPKGHWGGIGGRFGKKIGELIHLPDHVLSSFDEATTVR